MATETSAAEPYPVDTLPSAISTMIVRVMREYTGRGPMKARTTVRDNVVLVMLEQALTKGEQVLVEKGRGENVLVFRHEYQEAIRDESSEKIAELTGRNVIAMMSDNDLVLTSRPRSTSWTDHPSSARICRETGLSCQLPDISARHPG